MPECRICGDKIPQARLEVSPNTITCSHKCSQENLRELRRKAKNAWKIRQEVAAQTAT